MHSACCPPFFVLGYISSGRIHELRTSWAMTQKAMCCRDMLHHEKKKSIFRKPRETSRTKISFLAPQPEVSSVFPNEWSLSFLGLCQPQTQHWAQQAPRPGTHEMCGPHSSHRPPLPQRPPPRSQGHCLPLPHSSQPGSSEF